MSLLRAAVFAVAATFASLPAARAADLGGGPAPRSFIPAPSVFSWTGFYIGTHLAYGWSDADWEGVSNSMNGSGWLVGGQVGYNWQRGALVYGLEADASSSWVDGSGGGCCGYNVNWLASIRARAGVAINNNRTFLYGTGGVAWADIDYANSGFARFSDTHFGWVAGAGIEQMLTQNLSARVEYLYYGLNESTAPAGVLGAGATKVDPALQTVRFGINLKF